MPTPTGSDVQKAAAILREGGLVAFPTETVYGLGADACNTAAVARVFEVKNRPRFDPLIVHVAAIEWLERLAAEIPPTARKLAERFWPGPLTLVLPKTDMVPDLVTAGLPTVAVRIPDQPLALELLRAVDLPIAAPSANPFGKISPTTAVHVAAQIGDRVDYILDGGPCRIGIESTVVLLDGEQATLLRAGGLPLEDLEAIAGPVSIPESSTDSAGEAQLSPGRLSKHYAPRARLLLVENLADFSPEEGQRAGLLTFEPAAETQDWAACEVLSPGGDLREAAANFFAALHRLDARDLDLIVAAPFPEQGLGRALNDRLRRASAE